MILTLIGEIVCCLKGDANTVLDLLGSHVEENHIGTIRYLCKGNNCWENVKHQESRHEFICRESNVIFYKPQPKRLNVGGCQLKDTNLTVKCFVF